MKKNEFFFEKCPKRHILRDITTHFKSKDAILYVLNTAALPKTLVNICTGYHGIHMKSIGSVFGRWQ